MARTIKGLGAACAALLSAVGIAACGSGMRSRAVIEVRGHAISRAAFAHWMSVTAIRDYELLPRGPVPSWVLPDPPHYKICIAHLRAATSPGSASAPRPTSIAAKTQCQRRFRELRRQVLTSLTTAEWLISEGEELGLKVTAADVRARFETAKKNLFANEAAFRRYLANTGETVADQLFRAEVKVYSARLEERVRAELRAGKIGQRALARRATGFPRKWAAETSCSSGYVLPNCKQYKGASPPATEVL